MEEEWLQFFIQKPADLGRFLTPQYVPENTDNRVSVIDSKCIRIRDISLSVSKIDGVSYRHSVLWWSNPYVVTVDYQKRTTEFLFGGNHLMVPITSHYVQYKFKCRDNTSAHELVQKLINECPHLENK